MIENRKWWKEGVVYQIYPRSFQDSNGDGIGDIPGIIQRLDYIKSLGVDIVWLNPIYKSPNDDNGYDISDYTGIMEDFGNMQDFHRLLSGMKERGLKLVMDLVVNHSSDEHEWFVASRSARNNPYRDYYHWWPAENGTPPRRWSYFDVEGNAWQYEKNTDAYYLHYFSKKQPDLKWENPKVREEIYEMMKFWFEKGVDGFRMDVISFLSKDTGYPELPEKYKGDFAAYYADGPKLHEYLREMHREVLSKYDIITVGEAPGVKVHQALPFVDEERKELNMFFHFDLMALDRKEDAVSQMRNARWKLTEFKNIFSKWDAVFANKGWGSLFLNNHDYPRAVSRWGNDSGMHWYNSATMLQTFLLTMRGTPFFYYGDEIGMTNIGLDAIEDYRDINSLIKFEAARRNGEDLSAVLKNEKQTSRDNARTPMQWDTTTYAGFSENRPWLRVNENYKNGISVSTQDADKDSVLNYFRKMVQIRKEHRTLVYGQYQLLLEADEQVYSYTRILENDRYLIVLNFSAGRITVKIPLQFQKARLLISNDEDRADALKETPDFTLEPYQSMVYKLF